MLAVEALAPEEFPAEALSLGELLVEALPVADTFPVEEAVLDPSDDTWYGEEAVDEDTGGLGMHLAETAAARKDKETKD